MWTLHLADHPLSTSVFTNIGYNKEPYEKQDGNGNEVVTKQKV